MNDDKLTLPAPAKINLFLNITRRRDDGYHELQTLFQLLDYGDELSFRRRKDEQITLKSTHPAIVEADNLVYRAAKALQAKALQVGTSQTTARQTVIQSDDPQGQTQGHLGADIQLTKRLPLGGGLGGGSSDAATTLIGLNQVWRLNYSREELAEIGLSLGADVPVFIHGRTAWAEGTGEILSPVDLPSHWYLILIPDCEVSTKTIFSHEQLTRDAHAITIRAFLEQGGRNTCQPIAEMLYPGIKKARKWLEQYATAQMTGTGACVFAAFDSEQEARQVLADIPERWQGFIARGVNQSPAYPKAYSVINS